MSYYEDERSRYKSSKSRRRDDYDDMSYDTRDAKAGTIVRRARDDSVSSVEEVTRDFPPGERGDGYYRETTVRKSGRRPISRSKSYDDDDDYYDDRRDDRSVYSRRSRHGHRDDDTYVSRRSRRHDDRDDRRSRKYDSYSDSSRSRSPPPKKDKERRKSTAEEMLKSIGLGGVAGALPGLLGGSKDKDKSRSRSRDRDSRARSRRSRSSSSSRSRSRDEKKHGGKERGAEALKAALLAGVVEAVRARKQPGGWGGEKGKRVLTSAISAGGVNGILSHNRGDKDHSTRDVIGSTIAGLATNRIVNGSRSKSRGPATDPDGRPVSPDGRGRSRSRGIGDLAAGGALGAAGKGLWDRVRSKSRGRARSRESSYDSYDSRSQTRPKPERKRSASVSAAAAKGLAALGLNSAADKIDPERRKSQNQHDDRGYDDRRQDDRRYDDRRHHDDYSDYDRPGRDGGYRDPRDFR